MSSVEDVKGIRYLYGVGKKWGHICGCKIAIANMADRVESTSDNHTIAKHRRCGHRDNQR